MRSVRCDALSVVCSRGEAEVVESCGRSRSRGRTTQELASRYHELREIPALLVSAEARESSLALSGLATGPGLTGCLRRAHGWLEMQPTDLHSQPVIGPGGGGWSNYATGSRVSSAMPSLRASPCTVKLIASSHIKFPAGCHSCTPSPPVVVPRIAFKVFV
ncbi:hypothetical protein HL42_4706 [Trichophyton rubrum]|nr:hypothetical protein HL42_4706 [Trichophyton rubrum]